MKNKEKGTARAQKAVFYPVLCGRCHRVVHMKKFLSLLLCLTLVLGFTVPALAAAPTGLTWDGKPSTLAEIAQNTGSAFADKEGNYQPLYYDSAKALWEKGLFLGYDGSFHLDKSLTRVEGVVMMIRMLGKEKEAKATTDAITFTDVSGWAKPYVAYAAKNGLTKGYSDTKFGGGDAMTATQFLTFALRAMGYRDGEDFQWNKAYDAALSIGLIGTPCHSQYSRSNLFLRDNAAVISYNALFTAPAKSGGKLADGITMPGRPSGSVPTAVKENTTKPTEPEQPSGQAYYALYPSVPTYDSVDKTASGKYLRGGDNYAYYYYKPSAMDTASYREALKKAGFTYTGTVKLSLLSTTLEFYSKGDIHVAFGKSKTEFHVRIARKTISSRASANELGALWSLLNK